MGEEDKWRDAFRLFDRDGDGKISTGEIGLVMRALEQAPTEEEVKEITKGLSGPVDFDQFKEIMYKNKKEVNAESDIRDALYTSHLVFDKHGEGTVATSELRAVLTSMGEKLPEEEVDGIIQATDVGGQIKVDDFIAKLLRPT